MPLPAPAVAGYEIKEALRSRRGAICHLARQVSMDRSVWLQYLPAGLPAEVVERFVQVARWTARLNHPQLVRIIEAGTAEGRGYIVFETPPGHTLADEIARHGPFEWPEALPAAIELFSAIDALHNLHIASGDVSPDTVFVDSEGHLRLLFTGIALEAANPFVPPERRRQPQRGIRLKTDVYAAGGVLLYMLSGEPPTIDSDMPNPRDLAFMPEVAGVLIERMLAYEPAERPRMSQVLGVLRELTAGNAVALEPPASSRFVAAEQPLTQPRQRARTPVWTYVLTCLLLAGAIVAAAVSAGLQARSGAPPPDEAVAAPGAPPVTPAGLPDPGRAARPQAAGTSTAAPATPSTATESAGLPAASVVPPVAPAATAVAPPPAAAADGFSAAQRYAQEHPQDIDGIIARFQEVARRSQSPELTEKCAAEANRYKETARQGLIERLAADIALAKQLAAAGKLPEALAMLKAFDEAALEPREIATLRNAMDEITAPLRAQADDISQQIAAALKKQDLAAAERGLAAMAAIALPDVEQRIARATGQIEAFRRQLEEKKRREAQRALQLLDQQERQVRQCERQLAAIAELEDEVAAAVSNFKTKEAIAAVRNNVQSLTDFTQLLNLYLNLLTAVDERIDRAVANLQQAGEDKRRITLRKGGIALSGYVTAVSREAVTLRLQEGPGMEVRLYDMDSNDFFRYAELDAGRAGDLMDKAGFLFFSGKRAEAVETLKQLAGDPEFAARANALLERIQKSQERELAASQLLIKARRAYYNQDAGALQQALDALEQYAGTKAYQAAQGQ